MTLSATPDTATSVNALSPLRFPPDLRLKPEQFALLCAENREAVLELAADGRKDGLERHVPRRRDQADGEQDRKGRGAQVHPTSLGLLMRAVTRWTRSPCFKACARPPAPRTLSALGYWEPP